jgi:uncharacterized protein (TIGR03435 family)
MPDRVAARFIVSVGKGLLLRADSIGRGGWFLRFDFGLSFGEATMTRKSTCLGALALFWGWIPGPMGYGQSDNPRPQFEVTDARPSAKATNPYTNISGGVLRGQRYDLRKATMLDLIHIAYTVDADKVVGGPNWLELDRFDVAGKAPESTSPETLQLMLQSLLEDRFGLLVHKDTRPLPGFALAAGKGKPKMKVAADTGDAGCQPQTLPGAVAFVCRNMSMDGFAQRLRGMARDYLTLPVTNATGLDGVFDFGLNWNARSQVLPPGVERTTIFSAIDEQLGLALEPRKIPTPVLVVDRVNEKPTPNAPDVAQKLPPRPLEFEVADVKPSRPDEPRAFRATPGGGLEVHANSLRILISTAWDIDWDHSTELIAGPKWLDTVNIDILAKPSSVARGSAPPGADFLGDDLRMMLRSLLTDRFRMKTHYEDRPVKAYALSADKPKLVRADPGNRTTCRTAGVVPNDPRDRNPMLTRLIVCQNITMTQFAAQLQRLVPGDIPDEVLDATEISGAWDFTLSFTPGDLLRAPGPDADPNGGISLFDAIHRELGLKLEMRKRMLPVLVIDQMQEKPTAN